MFSLQLFSKSEILVTSSSYIKPYLFLIYFIPHSEEVFNKYIEMTEKHGKVLYRIA